MPGDLKLLLQKFVRADGGRMEARGDVFLGHDCMIVACVELFGVTYDAARDLLIPCGMSKNGMPNVAIQYALDQVGKTTGHSVEAFVPAANTNTIRFLTKYHAGSFAIIQNGHILAVKDGCIYDNAPTFGRHIKFAWQIKKQ